MHAAKILLLKSMQILMFLTAFGLKPNWTNNNSKNTFSRTWPPADVEGEWMEIVGKEYTDEVSEKPT